MVFQLGIGDFHYLWLVDGNFLLGDGQLVENLTAHHLLHLSRLRLVWSFFPPVSCVVERTPPIRRFLGLHEATNVNLKPVYLIENHFQVKPARKLLHILLDSLRLLTFFAEFHSAYMAKQEGDRILIEDEQLHLLTEGHSFLPIFLPP